MRPLAGYGAAISCTRVVGQVRYSIEAIVGAGAGIAANAVVVAASEYGVLSVKVERRRALTCAVLHRMRPYASDRHFEGLAAMSIIPDGEFTSLVQTYGYGVVGALIALESMGLPVPGETDFVPLPPESPRGPLWQTLAWSFRPLAFMARNREEIGSAFSVSFWRSDRSMPLFI